MFIDTNVLVHAVVAEAPAHDRAQATLAACGAQGESLCISRQVLREFLAVVTRPQAWAEPMPLSAAMATARSLESEFELLEDGPLVWDTLIDLS